MTLIFVIGPPAVGKMTVGRELAELTGFKLFHNHLSLELVNQFFDFGTPPFQRLDQLIRFGIFREVAQSDLPGLIFTLVWAHNEPEDEAYVDEIAAIFREQGADVHYLELKADLSERLKRNQHEDRIRHKPSKSNKSFSKKMLLQHETEYRMNTLPGEYPDRHILTVDNTYLSPREVAEMAVAHFGFSNHQAL